MSVVHVHKTLFREEMVSEAFMEILKAETKSSLLKEIIY